MSWRLTLTSSLMLTMTALIIVVRLQYVDNARLKQTNHTLTAEYEAVRTQFTQYEQLIAQFNTVAGATQDAHQKALQQAQSQLVQIQAAITPERCAHLPVPVDAARRLRAHADKISARSARAHTVDATQ
ncbi:MAG: hypothetical protein HamCj_00930 [Candidatus Hamiltonella defensa (Ceratovacuna japonica)]